MTHSKIVVTLYAFKRFCKSSILITNDIQLFDFLKTILFQETVYINYNAQKFP